MPSFNKLKIDFEHRTVKVGISAITFRFVDPEKRTKEFNKHVKDILFMLSEIPDIIIEKTEESIKSYYLFDFGHYVPDYIWQMAWDYSLLSKEIQQQLTSELILEIVKKIYPTVERKLHERLSELLEKYNIKGEQL